MFHLPIAVFTPRLRYSGASIGYQMSSVISGGPAPLIATALLTEITSVKIPYNCPQGLAGF